MKQTNKLLSISNIMVYIFVLIISSMYKTGLIASYFGRYVVTFVSGIILINGIFNCINGIINIKKNNKEIGIISIIISVMFIYEGLYLLKINFIKNEIGYLCIFSIIISIILTLVNCIINKKNNDFEKKEYQNILLIIGLFIELIIIILPIIFTSFNLKQFEKALNVIKDDENKRIVVAGDSKKSIFLDEDRNLISSKSYRLLPTLDCKLELDTYQEVSVLIAKEDNGVWFVDYSGNNIAKIYTLFENKDYFAKSFLMYLNEKGYEIIEEDQNESHLSNSLVLQEKTKDIYKFGDIDGDECQIVVELNKNELENDLDLYNKIDCKYGYFISDEERDLFYDFYKYKKNYSFIDKNGGSKKLECNNLVFRTNVEGKIAISKYSNNYIPYYDEDSTGYFDKNGEKKSFEKKYLIENATDDYAILYNIEDDEIYAYTFENNQTTRLEGVKIEYYDNKLIFTDNAAYMLESNRFNLLSESVNLGVAFINIDKETEYLSPYKDYNHINFEVYNK